MQRRGRSEGVVEIKPSRSSLLIGAMTAVSLTLLVWRGGFWLTSVETTGTVVRVTAEDGNCGSTRNRYHCTKFGATLEYRADGRRYRTDTGAGQVRGAGRPTTLAAFQVGQQVPVRYSTVAPSLGCRDSLWDLWGYPVLALIGQLVLMLALFVRGGRRAGPAW